MMASCVHRSEHAPLSKIALVLCVASMGARPCIAVHVHEHDLVNIPAEGDAKCVKALRVVETAMVTSYCSEEEGDGFEATTHAMTVDHSCSGAVQKFLATAPGTDWKNVDPNMFESMKMMFASEEEDRFVPFLWSGFWGGGNEIDSFDALDAMTDVNDGYRLETTPMGAALDGIASRGKCEWVDNPPSRIKTLFQHASHMYALAAPKCEGSCAITIAMNKDPADGARPWTSAIFNEIELPTLVGRIKDPQDDFAADVKIYSLKSELSCTEISDAEGTVEMVTRLKVLDKVWCYECDGRTPAQCLQEEASLKSVKIGR